ncbi:MobF family relaxase [Geobacter anodireducens]
MRPMKVSAGQATNYYYQKDPVFGGGPGDEKANGVWIGEGAKALGLRGGVDLTDFTNVLHGLDPRTEQRLVGKNAEDHAKYAALDIPLAAPKSFSIAALYDPELREAFQRAALSTAEGIERYVRGRETEKGVTREVQGGMAASVFFHGTNRENEPHMHAHVVISNMVQRPDGSWSTLENREIYRNQRDITMEFYGNLAVEARRLGYEIELNQGRGGQVIPELAAVPREVREAFATRHEQVEAAKSDLAAKLPAANVAEVEAMAQRQSRKEKSHAMSEGDIRVIADKRLAGFGITPDHLTSRSRSSSGLTQSMSADEYLRVAIADLGENESTFSPKQALSAAMRLSVGDFTRADLEKAWPKVARELVTYDKDTFTTPEMANIERRVATVAVEQSAVFSPLMSLDEVSRAVEAFEGRRGFSATPGQRSAIEHVLTSAGRLMVIQGDAGSGKSTAFDAINAALEDRDVTVRGFGFQGKAAAELQASSGIQSQTIDSFLLSRPEAGEPGQRQLWIVDEASMVGSRQLGAMLERAEAANAQIVLVGDSKQLSAIAAGRLFADLQEHGLVNTAIMDEVRRQKTGYTKEVATALKQHDVARAFEVLGEHGKISEIDSRDARIEEAARLYVDAGDQEKTLALTATNRDRVDLVQAIRERQKEAGIIGENDVAVRTRQPVSLQGVEKRLAANYEAGNLLFLAKPIADLRQGSELRIEAVDVSKNVLTAVDAKGERYEIDTRKEGGKLSQFREELTQFAEGEKIVFTKNDNTDEGKSAGIKNGTIGVIQSIQDDGTAVIKLENGNVVERNLNGENVTNGQVLSTHKSQGVTAQSVIVMMDSGVPEVLLSENLNYVAMSRMTHDLMLVTDDAKALQEAVENPQEKTSTLDHQLDRLDAVIARLDEKANESEPQKEREDKREHQAESESGKEQEAEAEMAMGL